MKRKRKGKNMIESTNREAGFWIKAVALAPLAVHGLWRELVFVVELAGEAEGGGKVVVGDAASPCSSWQVRKKHAPPTSKSHTTNTTTLTAKSQRRQLRPAAGRSQRTQPFVRHSLFQICAFEKARR